MTSRVSGRGPAGGATGEESTDTSPPDPATAARLGRLALILAAVGLVVCIYAVHAQMPTNAVSLPYEQSLRRPMQQLLPEGWAFFTRSPREPDLVPFTRDGEGRWSRALRAPHAEPHNVFGLDRRSRAQGVEMGLLTGGLTANDWRDCRGAIGECLEQAPAVRIANLALAPTLCGDGGLASQPPVPWAWSRSADETTMPSRTVRLEVSC
jgi:antimicrobial peptide system SdpA family protein